MIWINDKKANTAFVSYITLMFPIDTWLEQWEDKKL